MLSSKSDDDARRHQTILKWSVFMIISFSIFLLASCGNSGSSDEPLKKMAMDTFILELPDDYSSEVEYLYKYDSIPRFIGLNCYRTDLSKLENTHDTALLASFFNTMFQSMMDDTPIEYYPMEEFWRWLFTIDINNDGSNDVIYSGPSQGEPEITIIFVKKGSGFYKVFSEFQYFSNVRISDGKIIGFVLNNPGCCDDDQVVIHEYDISYNKGWPQFKRNKTHGYTTRTENPRVLFGKPLAFSVSAAFMTLVTSTLTDSILSKDELDSEYQFLARYKEGATGIALGGKRNRFGEWLFVRMDPSSKLVATPSFSSFLEHPTHIYGWIRMQDICWIRDAD